MNAPLTGLVLELRAIETRLGTPEESADDFERARLLAHAINNAIACRYLERDVAALRTSAREEPIRNSPWPA